jgi:hypothetical protein
MIVVMQDKTDILLVSYTAHKILQIFKKYVNDSDDGPDKFGNA